MADGSIRISTKLDTSTLKQQIKELNSELDAVRKKQAKANVEADKIKAGYAAESEIDAQFGEFSHKEYIDEKYKEAIAKAKAEQDELNQEEQEYISRLSEANAKLAEQEATHSAIAQINESASLSRSVDKIQSQKEYNSELEKTIADMKAIEAQTERIAAERGLSKDNLLAENEKYQKLSDKLGMLKARASDFGDEAQAAGIKTKAAMTQAEKSTKRVSEATRRGIMGFGRMGLALMAIRFAMRAISAATREYMAVNSELEGQINTLKALWGQVLGPVIQWVINLLIQAISYVNAFIYALSGINLVAKANEAALKKQANAAGGGGSGGNQTASFDEQTKLSGASGGGSSGTTATLPDGTTIDMSFLDPLKEALKKFHDDIKPFLTTLKELGGWILENILIPVADWAANSVLPAVLNILGAAFLVLNDALWKLQPIALWIWENFLKPIAEWTGGVIVDVLNAIGNWIRDHKDSLSTVVAIAIALYAALEVIPIALSLVSGAFALLGTVIASPITWITALIALLVTMYDECEGFRDGMNKVWTSIKEIFKAAVDFIKAMLKGDWAGMEAAEDRIVKAAKDLWKGLLEGLKAGWEWIKDKLKSMWKKISTAFCEFFGIKSPSTLFATYGKYMMEGLVNGIKGALSKVKSACKTILNAIKDVFANVASWFKDKFTAAWTAVKNVFSKGGKIFDGIKDGISSTFKTIVNGLITGINKIISTPFNSINKMLNKIRTTSILGVQPFKSLWSYNPLSVPKIPKLALGGIVNRPGRGVPAIIGEAGAEAVLPLENNTEWMDILADKINGSGNITIPIYMDGKKIYTYMVDIGKRKAFAANGG